MKETLTKDKFKAIFMSFLYFILSTCISLFNSPTIAQVAPRCELPQFGVVYVDPDIQVNGAGQNVDTIEFWKAPDSTETLMFVTAKNNHLVEVWKYPFVGNELTPLRHSTFNSGQVNGVVVDQDADLLYVSIGSSSSTVSVFSLPGLNFVRNFNKSGANYHSEPNLTLLNLSDGKKNVYVSADFTVYIHDAVTGDFISEFDPTRGLETLAPDSFYQRLYIPDENGRTGIYVYKPDGSPYTENGGSHVFGTIQFNADAEGIIVYKCPLNNPVDQGNGFIVVSDQRSSQTDFEFFDRITWEHLGTLRISGVSNTDGIASYPYPLPDYPLGVFAAIDDDHSTAIVGWDTIFEEILATTDVKDMNTIPQNFELYQNYPNPFNPTTRIKY
jgi:WD40 repeat protein